MECVVMAFCSGTPMTLDIPKYSYFNTERLTLTVYVHLNDSGKWSPIGLASVVYLVQIPHY